MRELRDQEEVCKADPKHRANKIYYPLRDRVRDSEQSIIGESWPPIEPVKSPLGIVEDLETVVGLSSVVRHERTRLLRGSTSMEINIGIRCRISGSDVKET
jgi:hypothetical protein